jgi:hypothetical protein
MVGEAVAVSPATGGSDSAVQAATNNRLTIREIRAKRLKIIIYFLCNTPGLSQRPIN